MKTEMRRAVLAVAGIVAVIGAFSAWLLLGPGPLDFASPSAPGRQTFTGKSPFGVPASLAASDLITKGQYLSRAADCAPCHTAAGGMPFAGGRSFKTPFGTLYSPNITADKDTGIGTWSDADFLRAVHRGIAKDGSHLYPAFPYPSYSYLADDDVLAIKAYIFSLPVARSVPPSNTLGFPFNQRSLMAIWGEFYNPDARFQPHPDRNSDWNRGAYLVEGLGHCGDCHTPRNLAQALNNRQKFAGTIVDGWHAFNITPDAGSGIGAWSNDQLVAYLKSGHAQGRGSATGPMGEVIENSLSALTNDDLRAMVVYMQTVPAIHSDTQPPARLAPAPEQHKLGEPAGADHQGKQIYASACVSCHGWSGQSQIWDLATLTGGGGVNDGTGRNVAQVVLSGASLQTPDGRVTMPAFGKAYSNSEIAAVTNYVTGRFGASASRLTAADIAKLR